MFIIARHHILGGNVVTLPINDLVNRIWPMLWPLTKRSNALSKTIQLVTVKVRICGSLSVITFCFYRHSSQMTLQP